MSKETAMSTKANKQEATPKLADRTSSVNSSLKLYRKLLPGM